MKKTSEAQRRANRKWHAANPSRMREYRRRYRAANKQKVSEYNRAYRQANPDKRETREQANEYNRRYYERHYHRIIEKNDRRKDRMVGELSPGIIDQLLELQNWLCAYHDFCWSDLKETGYELDHIMPIALGGTNTDNNVQLLCPFCNRKKSNLHPLVFLRVIGLSK